MVSINLSADTKIGEAQIQNLGGNEFLKQFSSEILFSELPSSISDYLRTLCAEGDGFTISAAEYIDLFDGIIKVLNSAKLTTTNLLERISTLLLAILDTTQKWIALFGSERRWRNLSIRTRCSIVNKYRSMYIDLFDSIKKHTIALCESIQNLNKHTERETFKSLSKNFLKSHREHEARFSVHTRKLEQSEGRQISQDSSKEETNLPITDLETALQPLKVQFDAAFRLEQGTRDWVLSDIESWRCDLNGHQFRVLFAGPGFGKTGIIAELLTRMQPQRDVVAVHFCTSDVPESVDPRRMLKNMSYQIIEEMRPETRSTIADAVTSLVSTWSPDVTLEEIADHLIVQLLYRLAKTLPGNSTGRKLLIIDGLDSLDGAMIDDFLECFQKHIIPRLPTFVCFLVTSRADTSIERAFSNLGIYLDAPEFANNLAQDSRIYIRKLLTPHIVAEKLEASISVVERKSEGHILYLHLLRKKLEETGDEISDPLDVYRLPNGLIEAYDEELKHVLASDSFGNSDENKTVQRILEVIMVASTPLLIEDLSVFSDVDTLSIRQLLNELQTLFSVKDGRVNILHSSVMCWLKEKAKADSASPADEYDLKVSQASGHTRLSEVCTRVMLQMDFLNNVTYESDQPASDSLKEYSCRGDLTLSPSLQNYAIHFGVLHLIRANKFDVALSLLTSLSYIDMKLAYGEMQEIIDECQMLVGTTFRRNDLKYSLAAEVLLDSFCLTRKAATIGGRDVLDEQLWQRLWKFDKILALRRLASDCRARVRGTGYFSAKFPFLHSASSGEIKLEAPAPITCLGFGNHADNEFVASACDATIKLWGLSSFEAQTQFSVNDGLLVTALAAYSEPSSGKARIVSGLIDGTIQIWDIESPHPLKLFLAHSKKVTGLSSFVEISKSNSLHKVVHIVSISLDMSLHVYDGFTLRTLLSLQFSSVPLSLACLERSGKMVLGFEDHTMKFCQAAEGIDSSITKTLVGHTGAVSAVVCFEEGNSTFALSGSIDKTVRLWQLLPTDMIVRVFTGHSMKVQSISTPFKDGGSTYFASGSLDRTLRIWNLDGREVLRLNSHTGGINCCTCMNLTSGTVRIISGGADNCMRIWSPIEILRQRAAIEKSVDQENEAEHLNSIHHIMFQNKKPGLVTGHKNGTIKVWALDPRREILATFRAHNGEIPALASFTIKEGTFIVSAGLHDKTVKVWSREHDTPLFVGLGHSSSVSSLVTVYEKNNSPRVVSGSWDKTLRVWDPIESKILAVLRGHRSWITSIVGLPSDNDVGKIASVGEDRTIRIWKLDCTTAILILGDRDSPLATISCYDDAMGAPCIVAGGEHANLELWSLELRGKKLGTLQGHRKGIRDVACFSDAGNRAARILSAADDLTVRLWCPSTMICLAIYIADAPLLSFSALAAAEDSTVELPTIYFICGEKKLAALEFFTKMSQQMEDNYELEDSGSNNELMSPSRTAGVLLSPSRGKIQRQDAPATPHDVIPFHTLVTCIKNELGIDSNAKLPDAIEEAAESLGIAANFPPNTPLRQKVNRIATELGVGK